MIILRIILETSSEISAVFFLDFIAGFLLKFDPGIASFNPPMISLEFSPKIHRKVYSGIFSRILLGISLGFLFVIPSLISPEMSSRYSSQNLFRDHYGDFSWILPAMILRESVLLVFFYEIDRSIPWGFCLIFSCDSSRDSWVLPWFLQSLSRDTFRDFYRVYLRAVRKSRRLLGKRWGSDVTQATHMGTTQPRQRR